MRFGVLVVALTTVFCSCASSGERAAVRPECPRAICGPTLPVASADVRAFLLQPPQRLILTPFGDGQFWFVRESFTWKSHLGVVTVPAGFVTDFASIPRMFWSLLPKWDGYGPPAIVHDFLYWNQPVSRFEADEWILAGMEDMHVSSAKAHTIYTVLRLLGSHAWASDGEAQARGEHGCVEPVEFQNINLTTRWIDYRHEHGVRCPVP